MGSRRLPKDRLQIFHGKAIVVLTKEILKIKSLAKLPLGNLASNYFFNLACSSSQYSISKLSFSLIGSDVLNPIAFIIYIIQNISLNSTNNYKPG